MPDVTTIETLSLLEVISQALSSVGVSQGDALTLSEDSFHDLNCYRRQEALGFSEISILKAISPEPTAPSVSAFNPANGQTFIRRNAPVTFSISSVNDDWVDIYTVTVQINGTTYDCSDAEFSYSGTSAKFNISVTHTEWGYNEGVTVVVNGSSMAGANMTAVTYSFTTEWESTSTRGEQGRIELYIPNSYGINVLTWQENWMRQGTARYSTPLELWYGRFQSLPYVEDIEMRVIPGDTVGTGSEAVANGYFSVQEAGVGEYQTMTEDTVIHLGPFFSHTFKQLAFKLLVPEGALTKRYVTLTVEFKVRMMRTWGRFPWGVGIYSGGADLYNFHPLTFIYRAFVFDAAMWAQLENAGVIVTGVYRGEDKQW